MTYRARSAFLSALSAAALILGVITVPSTASAAGVAEGNYSRVIVNPLGGSHAGGAVDNRDAAVFRDRLYVWAYGAPNDYGLWAVAGTDVSEVAPDHQLAGQDAVVFRDRLLFVSQAPGVGINRSHIWEYDGINLRDLGDRANQGLGGGLGGALDLNGWLYRGDYYGLWGYDGVSFQKLSDEHVRSTDLRSAPDGTALVYVTDGKVRTYDGETFSTIYSGRSPQFPMVTDSHVLFQDSGVLYAYDWATGTTSSTYIGNTNGGPSTPNGAYLSAEGIASYCIPAECLPIEGPAPGAWFFVVSGGYVYFVAPDSAGDSQLWAVPEGETLATPVVINPTGGSAPFALRAYNGQLFLSADGGDGSGFWQVEGVNARLVAKPNLNGDSEPYGLGSTGDSVYFSASDGNTRDLFVAHPFNTGPAPEVTITSPSDGQTIVQGEPLTAAFSCSDVSSTGLASCSGTVESGASMDTSSLGSHVFTVRATDNDGNYAARSVRYVVVGPPFNPRGELFFEAADGIDAALPDGSGYRTLTREPGGDYGPSVSPDGRSVLFYSYRDDASTGEIYVMTREGADQRRLTNHPADDVYPQWSPDGSRIAFESTRTDDGGVGGPWRVFVMNADGSEVEPLREGSAGVGWCADWSPDGEELALTTDSSSIVAIDIATGAERNIASQTGVRFFCPRWSPDGSRLAFTGWTPGGGGGDVFVAPAEGAPPGTTGWSNITATPSVNEQLPEWSPDGSALTFLRHEQDGSGTVVLHRVSDGAQVNATNIPVGLGTIFWAPAVFDLPDSTPPSVTGSPDRDLDFEDWYSAPVTLTWTATDAAPSSGAPSVPSPTLVDTEGTGQVITSGESCDPAGNCATGSFTLNLDKTPPQISLVELAETVPFQLPVPDPVAIAVGADDPVAGIGEVEAFVGDDPGIGVATPLSADGDKYTAVLTPPATPGTYTVGIRARDKAGNWSDTATRMLTIADNDGVDSAIEDAAPNGGDGNNDGTPDSEQANVTSLPTVDDPSAYLSLESPEGTVLRDVEVVSIPSEIQQPEGAAVSLGALSYTVDGVTPGSTIDIIVFTPEDSAPNSIFKYVGQTFVDVSPYATFEGDRIILHLRDGDPAVDEDGLANGTIVDPVVPFRLAPKVSTVQAPQPPQRIGTPVALSATFDSPVVSGPFEYRFLVDGSEVANGTTSTPGEVTRSFTPTAPDISQVTFEVVNAAGDRAYSAAPGFLVTYDPSGGFVTGGGWIDSPTGAYRPGDGAALDVRGRASFGFVAKYLKGATTPTGKTEFHFQAGDLAFASTSYDWLVVSSDKKATFRGTGTISGSGGFRFQLTAYDGSSDRLRMKITDSSGQVVYDNLPGAADDADPILGTALGGGSIQIQRQ